MVETAEQILLKQINNVENDIENYEKEIGRLYVKTFDVDIETITKPSEMIPLFEEFRTNMPKLIAGLKQAEAQLSSLEHVEATIKAQNFES